MNTQELKERKVGDLVKENIKTAHVFKKYGIDFCCGGGISIQSACEKGNVAFDQLAADLIKLNEPVSKNENYDEWELDVLADYIVSTHHSYVSESIPLIMAYAQKVASVHGNAHQPVIEIFRLFDELAHELTSHMQKEELILFPYVRTLAEAKRNGTHTELPPFGSVQNPINMMEHEHDVAGGLLKDISEQSNGYTPPEWACNTFRALYAKLAEFEEDLHIHILLENNILFPKAVAMEKDLTQS